MSIFKSSKTFQNNRLFFAVLGTPTSGKTTFLRTLTKKIAIDSPLGLKQEYLDDTQTRNWEKEADAVIQEKKTEQQTAYVNNQDPEDMKPNMYELIRGKEKIIYEFFDPGDKDVYELSKKDDFQKYIERLDGLLILIDPLELPEIKKKRGKLQNSDECKRIKGGLSKIESKCNGYINELRKKNLAICLTGIDEITDMLPGYLLDSNGHNGTFNNKYHMDICSGVEEQLINNKWLDLELREHLSSYKNRAYFAFSTLGVDPCGNPYSDRVVDPFLWFLWRKALIDSDADKRKKKLTRWGSFAAATALIAGGTLFSGTLAFARYYDYSSAMAEGKIHNGRMNYYDAAEAYDKASKITGYEDDSDAIRLRDEALIAGKNQDDFNAAIADGKNKIGKKDYYGAVSSFEQALMVSGYQGNPETIRMRDDAMTAGEYQSDYNALMNEGLQKRGQRDYSGAVRIFEQALKLPGYENDTNAMMMRDTVLTAGKNNDVFYNAMADGRRRNTERDYARAVLAFEQALKVPGYHDDPEAKQLLSEALTNDQKQKDFQKALSDGKRRTTEKDYYGAVAAYERILKIADYENDAEIKRLRDEAAIAGKQQVDFNAAMSEGRSLYEEKDYYGSAAAFERALMIPGYTNNQVARQMRNEARNLGKYQDDFSAAMTEGWRKNENKDYYGAAAAYERVLKIPGYENDLDVKRMLNEAFAAGKYQDDFNAAIAEGRSKSEQKDYYGAAAAYDRASKIVGYDNDAVVKRMRDEALTAGLHQDDFNAAITESQRKVGEKDYYGAAAIYERILKIPGYENDIEISLMRERTLTIGKQQEDFNRAMSEARSLFSLNNYAAAVIVFERALMIPGYANDPVAIQMRNEARIAGNYQEHFNSVILEGKRKIEEKDYYGAAAAFEQALKINGYENDDGVKQMREDALTAGKNQDEFNALMLEGIRKSESRDYKGASLDFEQAVQITGYEHDADAIRMRTEALTADKYLGDFRAAIFEGQRKYGNGDYAGAEAEFERAANIPGYEDDKEIMQILETVRIVHKRQNDFLNAVKEGHEKYNNAEYPEAASAYERALNIHQHEQVRQWLSMAQKGDEYQKRYNAAIEEGNRLYQAKEFTRAADVFKSVMPLQQFVKNLDAERKLAEAQRAGEHQNQYNIAMQEGTRLYQTKDYMAAGAAFQRALLVPGYDGDALASQRLNEVQTINKRIIESQTQYNTAMEEGKGRFNAGDYGEAVIAFKRVLLIPGYSEDAEAMRWLATAQQTIENQDRFSTAMNEAKQNFQYGNFSESVKIVQDALDIQGFSKNPDALQLLQRAQQAQAERAQQIQQAQEVALQIQHQYSSALNEGQRLIKEGEGKFFLDVKIKLYKEAEQAFLRALATPGYERDPAGIRFLRDVRGEIQSLENRQAEASRNTRKAVGSLINLLRK